MKSVLELLLWLLGVGLGWATLGVPLLWLAIRWGRKVPQRARVRAVPWALAAAAWSGFVLGVAGLFVGAGVLDESAGEAALLLFAVGFGVGAPAGGLGAWLFISRRAQRPG